eukprot:gene26016-biopygen12982
MHMAYGSHHADLYIMGR